MSAQIIQFVPKINKVKNLFVEDEQYFVFDQMPCQDPPLEEYLKSAGYPINDGTIKSPGDW